MPETVSFKGPDYDDVKPHLWNFFEAGARASLSSRTPCLQPSRGLGLPHGQRIVFSVNRRVHWMRQARPLRVDREPRGRRRAHGALRRRLFRRLLFCGVFVPWGNAMLRRVGIPAVLGWFYFLFILPRHKIPASLTGTVRDATGAVCPKRAS